jgi:hypothetical protein
MCGHLEWGLSLGLFFDDCFARSVFSFFYYGSGGGVGAGDLTQGLEHAGQQQAVYH